MKQSSIILAALAMGVAACAFLLNSGFAAISDTPRCPENIICLEQGWSNSERSWWYSVSQGSRLLPLSWFLVLEQADSNEKFLSETNLRRLNYLPGYRSADNPYGLPLGFAVDKEEGGWTRAMCGIFQIACARGSMREPWVGMNCSACHTAQISYRDKAVRIDGGPTIADFQTFEETLLAALQATSSSDQKFESFAHAVLSNSYSTQAANGLRSELNEQIAWMRKVDEKNATPLRYGYGRLDAQGHILNKVSLVLGVQDQLTDYPSDAPASYPYIWNAPLEDKLQWNGIAENAFKFTIFGRQHDLGALVRNTAEVIGVFGQIDVDPTEDSSGYNSSLRLSRMIDIERQLGRLQSPRWPEHVLEEIDWELAAKGQQLYVGNCISCHAIHEPDNLKRRIKASMQALTEAKTDIWTACNSYLHRSKAGWLEGRKAAVLSGPQIASTDATRLMLSNVAVGAIIGRADELVATIIDDTISGGRAGAPLELPSATVEYLPGIDDPIKKQRARQCLTENSPLLAYKARPLNGIWATAPYLHNGSVPTLYDLLLPSTVRNTAPADAPLFVALGSPSRPENFHLGSGVFDPIKVGLASETNAAPPTGLARFEFRVRDVEGRPILGNYNSGHDYGTSLTEEDRWALVEYLKTL